MLEKFGRFFMSKVRPLRVSPEPYANLPDADALEAMMDVLEGMEFEQRYTEQNKFYQYLLGCHLLIPLPESDTHSSSLSVMALENGHGEKAMPIFSSEQTMRLWLKSSKDDVETDNDWDTEPTEYIAVPFDTLCTYALQAGVDYIVLNAAGPFGCEISFHDFSFLAEGLLPAPAASQEDPEQGRKAGEILVNKATPMRLAVCERISEALQSRLLDLFGHYQVLIRQVYLFDVGFNDGPMQPALGVRIEEGHEEDWELELWPNMQAVLCEMLERREVVNVFLLNQADSMEQHVKQVTPPIYERPGLA